MVVAVGISVVDHIMVIDGFNKSEGTYYCEHYLVEGGGMAATALCAASKLGSQTILFSRVGDDLNGDFIIEGLAKFGVNTGGVMKMPGCHSTASFVLVDRNTGEKQFYCEEVKSAYTDHLIGDFSLLSEATVLLVDGHWMEMASEAVKWAKKRGVKVVADFKQTYPGIEKLFPCIDYFIVPDFYARSLTGEDDSERMLRKLTVIQAGIPIVTQGEKGGMYLDGSAVKQYTAFPIDVVDSTGAGDAFHGAFCHFLDCGLDLDQCLVLASAVGALNCRATGGRAALPTKEELSHFLRSQNISDILS